MPSLLPSCSLLPPSPDLAEGDINTLHNIYIRQVLFTLQHLLGFEFLRHKRPELDIPLRCCDTVTGEREHKENITTPSETVNGFIRDSGGSFL